ncbi:MAG: hypothetical protein GC190_07270 [Alphaproteobacteria bacterium]|nr:hypothetical protein [Alphaproteobacteria bacterium]
MRIATILFALISLTACNSPTPATDEPPEPTSQPWICGREYVNFAWGYQRRGAVLDGDGHVWRYEFKGTPASLPNAWQPKDPNALTETELGARYNGAVDIGQRSSADDVAAHMPLIREAAGTPPTEGHQVGADMGATVLYCLARNVPGGTYRQVLIDQKGDIETTNPSAAAKQLATWLNRVLGTDYP